MHLLTFIQLREPGPAFRAAVILTQGIVYNGFFACYLLSPKTCHRFIGYLEARGAATRPPSAPLPCFVRCPRAPTAVRRAAVRVRAWRRGSSPGSSRDWHQPCPRRRRPSGRTRM